MQTLNIDLVRNGDKTYSHGIDSGICFRIVWDGGVQGMDWAGLVTS